MMRLDPEEIRARLKAADALDPQDGGPGGSEYVEAMRGTLAHAEALGDPELLFTARLSFTWALRFKPLTKGPSDFFVEALPILRRCLLMWHAEPYRFPDHEVRALWNQLFLIADAYIWLYPEPAQRVHRFLDELERHCPPTRTWTRYAIEHHRMLVDARRGDAEAVERRWQRLRAQGEPEEHMQLDGKATHEAVMWQRLGRNDRALEVLAPLAAGLNPAKEGGEYGDGLVMPYLRAGRFEEAVEAHGRTYARPGMKLEDVAAHLEFCARTGNEERGIEVLQRNLRRFEQDVTSLEAMWTAATAVLLCRKVMEKDLDREWSWSCDCGEPGCEVPKAWTYAEFASSLWWEVVNFSEKLDELNGTTFQSEKILALLGSAPIVGNLALPPGPARSPERKTVPGESIAVLAEPKGARHRLFSTIVGLARLPELGADRKDTVWGALPALLDRVLMYPTVHMAQIRGLLHHLERHVRPGEEDRHHLRWFAVEAEARRGDAAAAAAAWAAFDALPPLAAYTTGANVLRRTLWWVDLGCDDRAIASNPDREREDYLLLPYLRTGRDADARAVHERTWESAENAPEVAFHLDYCARTGHLAHADDLVQRHLGLFMTDRNDNQVSVDRLRVYGAVARLAERIVAANQDRTWTWPADDCCPAEEGWSYRRLADEYRAESAVYGARWRELR